MSYNVAIDGPSGAGKSTIAKIVASKLNSIYIDTGAMYRTIALYLIRNGIDCNNEEEIKKVIDNINVDIKHENDIQQLFLNNENVTNLIRTSEIGEGASACSQFPIVRNKLTEMQRAIGKKTNVVMDGRDIGTVVLPDAALKIFLTASLDVRAKRRYNEFKEKGLNTTFEETKDDLEKRDYRDTHRETAPLKQAEDAILIDSSDMSIEEVVEKILSYKKA